MNKQGDPSKPASVVACDPSDLFIELAKNDLTDIRASFITAGAEALLPSRWRLRPGGIAAAYVRDYAEGISPRHRASPEPRRVTGSARPRVFEKAAQAAADFM